jgi:hypothetical protein
MENLHQNIQNDSQQFSELEINSKSFLCTNAIKQSGKSQLLI